MDELFGASLYPESTMPEELGVDIRRSFVRKCYIDQDFIENTIFSDESIVRAFTHNRQTWGGDNTQ